MKEAYNNTTTARSEANTDRYVEDGLYSRMFFAGLLERTIKDGGSTNVFPMVKVLFDDCRYVVGNAKDGIVLSNRDFRNGVDLESFLAPYLARWNANCAYFGFGTWIDPETGNVCIDPVRLFNTRTMAIADAIEKGETAIYDRKRKLTIYV